MTQEHVESMLKVEEVFEPSKEVIERAWVKDYEKVYKKSVENPESFWGEIASELEWFKPWEKVLKWEQPWMGGASWFVGAKCNITYNCLDRHVKSWRRNKAAIIWVGENGRERVITYDKLLRNVNRCANMLFDIGVRKGDRVTIYLPRIPEQIISMLACARIGAIHSLVYSGFSSEALKNRIVDAESKIVITADCGYQRGKCIPLKNIVNDAVKDCPSVEKVFVVRRGEPKINLNPIDIDWHEAMEKASQRFEAVHMDSEDPLFMLYTSGTTGKPKGVQHVHGGYMVGTYITTKWVFDLKDEDIMFCTADPGWITGHSYIVYGPLLNGTTILFAEGAPDYPDPSRWWGLIEKYGVNIFYTTPTAVRLLMKYGDNWPQKHDLSGLRILGSVGEPINPEAWLWYRKITGNKLPIMDTWWQTETGMIMITPLPCMKLKPGSAARPFPGIEPAIVDRDGNPLPPNSGGFIVIKKPWPSMMKTIYKDPERYAQYWKTVDGFYMAGDMARQDEDGYFFFMGRTDDVIKVSGYRLGTAEIESAIVSHYAVAEAACIGKPDALKGEIIKAFVILKQGHKPSDSLLDEIKKQVRKELGPIAIPAEIEFTEWLPKTRSGKIMRRVLKAKELGVEPGDVSTLEE
ncbi:MAG: acetate--CoA ligase [Deltaproteobacteria bacterium GWC2_42_11]|nr:MAG: acetate--CoA ligase [Deltaproteobacteria bacterium GWC2_42_11]